MVGYGNATVATLYEIADFVGVYLEDIVQESTGGKKYTCTYGTYHQLVVQCSAVHIEFQRVSKCAFILLRVSFFSDYILITLLAPIEEDFPLTTKFLESAFEAWPPILQSHAETLFRHDFFSVGGVSLFAVPTYLVLLAVFQRMI